MDKNIIAFGLIFFLIIGIIAMAGQIADYPAKSHRHRVPISQTDNIGDSVFLIYLHNTENINRGFTVGTCFVTECNSSLSGGFYYTTFHTAGHVMENIADYKYITITNHAGTYRYETKNLLENYKYQSRDIARFQVVGERYIKPLQIARSYYYEKGDEVRMYSRLIMCSEGVEFFTRGEITYLSTDVCGTNLFGRTGNSGSPILNRDGEVIGVATGIEYFNVNFSNGQWRPLFFDKLGR